MTGMGLLSNKHACGSNQLLLIETISNGFHMHHCKGGQRSVKQSEKEGAEKDQN